MSSNILITGAAGYVGGSIAADFVARTSTLFRAKQLFVAVRSREQLEALSKQEFHVLQLNLGDKEAVAEVVQRHEINIIIHCASGLEQHLALNLIQALGKRQQLGGGTTHFIHTSGGSAYSEHGGWTHGEVKDTDALFELEKEFEETNPLRQVNVAVTKQSKVHGVTSYIVVPPLVYGRGGGEWNKLSVCIPRYITASIAHKAVYKFAEDLVMPAVHISDLTAFYARLVEKILQGEQPPSGEQGYYFTVAHQLGWWDTLKTLARGLYSRGLVVQPETQVWPSDEMAAEALAIPVQFMHMIWNSRTRMIPEKREALEWQPVWDKAQFMQHLDDEIKDVLELNKVRSSVFDAMEGSSAE